MADKLTRDAFIYLPPNGDKQCGTCRDFSPQHQLCAIHGPNVKVVAGMSCGLYVEGEFHGAREIRTVVTPEESGLVDREVRCENCKWGGPEEYVCRLFRMLNQFMPDVFELDTEIEPKGCCNAQQPPEAETD